MCKTIMIGCDLHDATTVLKVAEGSGTSVCTGFATADRAGMIAWLKDFGAERGATRIVFAYEASAEGPVPPGAGIASVLNAGIARSLSVSLHRRRRRDANVRSNVWLTILICSLNSAPSPSHAFVHRASRHQSRV